MQLKGEAYFGSYFQSMVGQFQDRKGIVAGSAGGKLLTSQRLGSKEGRARERYKPFQVTLPGSMYY